MSPMTEEKKEALIKRYGSQYTTTEQPAPNGKGFKRGKSRKRGPGGGGMTGTKPKDAKLTIRRLFSYLENGSCLYLCADQLRDRTGGRLYSAAHHQ